MTDRPINRKKTTKPTRPAAEGTRLNRFIAQSGMASRRKADELIAAGKVRVNGRIVKELGTLVDPNRDQVQVRNRAISKLQPGLALFYKPRGVVTTLSDPEGRPSIGDYLTKKFQSYFPVGRLDFDSSGLIILTNDGDLAERLMHPRYGLERTYLARVEGSVPQGILTKLERGVRLPDGIVRARARIAQAPRDVRRPGARAPESPSTWLEITITEGRNRVVRRMMEQVGHSVIKLRRISHGPFKLGKMRPGEIRMLTEKDYQRMRMVVLRDPKLD